MSDIYQNHAVFFEEIFYHELNQKIRKENYSSVVVLVDNNTEANCLAHLSKSLSISFKTICIDAGEEYKTIQTCLFIWNTLSEIGADRNSLLISLGGGVITDIGGFTASCFKRGIAFVHIPTTLLCMVDAAIGGKNGVDLKTLKNQIGVIRPPVMIGIDSRFLETLPDEQISSGYAEMIKHGLIHSESYFEDCITSENMSKSSIIQLIKASVSIKLSIVEEDINEKGLRKALNYGHTLGHAIESFRMSLDKKHQLLHGEAVAIGLILETFISFKLFDFPKHKLDRLTQFTYKKYPFHSFDLSDQNSIIELMKHDKKNTNGNVNFVLLKDIGVPVLDCKVENHIIYEAFDYYHSIA